LATEWDEYTRINFRMVRKLMRGNVVFDGRNIFDADDVVREGLRYVGVGRSKEPATPSRTREVARQTMPI
jgi:UDPglucose 6-dehydrogenase